jgi:hypothetical protein
MRVFIIYSDPTHRKQVKSVSFQVHSIPKSFRLGTELNFDSSLLFSTFLKNTPYFIPLFQIFSQKVKPKNSGSE